MNLFLEEIIDVLGEVKPMESSKVTVSGVSTDTRTLSGGDLFFAIKGDNFDGSKFLKEAKDRGAVGAVVENDVEAESEKDFVIIKVDDSTKALGDLAKYYRNKLKLKVIAVTGSVGKTTTKDLIYSILVSGGYKASKTLGNFNNLIGLPLSVFKFEEDAEFGVLELGINQVGEMVRLAEISSPDVAVVTNIGRSHLEGLGTVEVVASEKLELFNAVRDGGVVVINADDIRIKEYSPLERSGIVQKKTFGFTGNLGNLDVEIKNISREGSNLMVNYKIDNETLEVAMDTPYQCNAYNGAAAIGAVMGLIEDLGLDVIKKGLESYSSAKGRMTVTEVGGVTIIDDTYNSNPESLKEALKALSCIGVDVDVTTTNRKIAVIGDMLELGEISGLAHIEAGEMAKGLGIDVVVAVGEFAGDVIEGAGGSVKTFSAMDARGAGALLVDIVKPGDSVLVKGSHNLGMEKIVERLKSN